MYFAHTYWMKPTLDDRYGYKSPRQITTHLFCYALSVSYIKKLGHNISLYADSRAIELLHDLPYDKVVELNIPETANSKFWAQSKFYTLPLMQPGETLIDGDIFIKSQEIIDRISPDYDVNIQSLETGSMLTTDAYKRCRGFMADIDFGPIFKPKEMIPICNSGILQINSQKVKDRYIEEYFKAVDIMKSLGKLDDMPNNINPDILLEQLLLNQLCIYNGYTLNSVFDTSEGPYLKINKDKYIHLISDKKYIMLPLVKKWLQELNPELYTKLLITEREILEKQINT